MEEIVGTDRKRNHAAVEDVEVNLRLNNPSSPPICKFDRSIDSTNKKQKCDKRECAEHHGKFPRYHSSSSRFRASGRVFRIANEVLEDADGKHDDHGELKDNTTQHDVSSMIGTLEGVSCCRKTTT